MEVSPDLSTQVAPIKQNLPNGIIDLLPEETPAERSTSNMFYEVESTTLEKQDRYPHCWNIEDSWKRGDQQRQSACYRGGTVHKLTPQKQATRHKRHSDLR